MFNFSFTFLNQVGQGAGKDWANLLGVFSNRLSSKDNSPLDSSALCIYPMDKLDQHIDSTRDLCYTKNGGMDEQGEVAYIEYEVKSSCASLPLVSLLQMDQYQPNAGTLYLAFSAVWRDNILSLLNYESVNIIVK